MNPFCRPSRRHPVCRGGWRLALVLLVAVARSQTATELEARRAEPGVSYGHLPDFPLPKTIVFSVGPDEILADAAEWARHGVNAFFLDFVARDWSSDIWATDGEPWTIGASDKTFQKVQAATAAARALGQEVFLKIAFDHFFEWFNDTAWQRIENNFRQFARFARDTGCTGLALDIEYVGEQYDYAWPGYDYRGYTRADLYRKVRERMTRVARVLYDEFPGLVLLTFPEQGFNLGGAVHLAWIEEAARRHAPGGVHYCTEHTYRNPNIRHMLAHAARCTEYFDRLLSARARRYWHERCSIAAGVWPFGFDHQATHAPGLTLEELRQGFAASLMVSRRYNWIYSHNSRAQLLGRHLEVYPPGFDIRPYLEVFARREIITTPRYVALAREIRALRRRDYTADLGLAPVVSLTGPSDTPHLRLLPAAFRHPREPEAAWRPALDYLRGAPVNFHEHFGTQTDWWLIGPFPGGERLAGHHTVYPPEQEIDLGAEYAGAAGKVRWRVHRPSGPNASVDLTKIFQPAENVCAYALGYVVSPVEQDAQLRFGSNDAAKVWLGGRLVHDYPHEGTVHLDRDIIPVRLPRGTTPLLIKVTNGLKNWGFVLRLTDAQGRPLKGVRFRLEPDGN
jgi:hypothetical protein